MNFILYLAELHIGSFISHKRALFGNSFHKYSKVKIILISFNCFSDYIKIAYKHFMSNYSA